MAANNTPHRFNGHDLLSRLKGPPLSVLLALAMYGEQGRPELIECTGWSRGAVSRALSDLVEMGLIERTHFRGWALPENLKSTLPLMLVGPDQHHERLQNSLSHVELPYDENIHQGLSNSPSDYEELSYSLSDTERLSDGSCAERSLEDPSEAEGLSNSPSTHGVQPDLLAEGLLESLSGPEGTPDDLSALYDDDHKTYTHKDAHLAHLEHHPSNQTTDTAATQQLLDALRQLDPPFENARNWLRQTSPALVAAWLDHFQGMDRQRRRNIRNEAAYLRAKVAAGRPPPLSRRDRRHRPCKECGKVARDPHGRCLVCAGVVKV